VITGFLGRGKTTLLRRLLGAPALADTAVLVNEFGEVGLNHHLHQRQLMSSTSPGSRMSDQYPACMARSGATRRRVW
jgi:G3E family GTPase